MKASHPALRAAPHPNPLPARRGEGIKKQLGVNLIELIMSIVIISIAVGGVLLVFTQTIRYSADPMIQQQAVAIAEGYMDEILARPVTDPGGGPETRATFDNVGDYNLLSETPPRNQNGIELDGVDTFLDGYTVTVAVTPNVPLGPVGTTVLASQVVVTVTRPPVVNFTLTGYRANSP